MSTELGDDYEILVPRMPNSNNAQYNEWKIYFSKIANVLNDEVVLIGNSLGGIFLAKYLSENTFPKKIRATILIAPPFDDIDSPDDRWSLMDFTLHVSLAKCAEQGGKIYLVYSQDDPIVSFAQLKKYQQALPSAQIMVFDNRQHFLHETFPEMVELIKLI